MRHYCYTPFIFLFSSFLFFIPTTYSQIAQGDLGNGGPSISVEGLAEKEIVPNEIYIHILLRERQGGKEKISITQQEEKLRDAVRAIGIDLSNLYLSDVDADFIRVKRKSNEVLTQKQYTLKVTTAAQVGIVFQQLDRLEITDAGIARVSHSKLDSLKKEIKIAAIKSAKEKADYLLAAIGEQTGKPLYIYEIQNAFMPMVAADTPVPRSYEIANVRDVVSEGATSELQFKKIKLEARISVRFAIK
jgi:hypothetical protein